MFLLLQDGARYQVATSTVTVLIMGMSWVRAPHWPPKKSQGSSRVGFWTRKIVIDRGANPPEGTNTKFSKK